MVKKETDDARKSLLSFWRSLVNSGFYFDSNGFSIKE
jgi:hypothetical protein